MSAPFGYLSLQEAADLAVRLDPTARGRGRVVATGPFRSGQVEVVAVVYGELELMRASELADAEYDFGSGRMKRGGVLSPPGSWRVLPDGTVELNSVVELYLGNYYPMAPYIAPAASEPAVPYVAPTVPAIAPPRPEPQPPGHNNFPPGVTALSGSAPEPDVVTYTLHGETCVDTDATRALRTKAEREAYSARTDRAQPAAQDSASFAGLTEEMMRDRMEEAADPGRHLRGNAAPAASVHGEAWGPVVFELAADIARFVKPPPTAAVHAETASPPSPATANRTGRPARYEWASARQAYLQR